MADDETKRAKADIRAMNRYRDFPYGTCPASRHTAMIAEHLVSDGVYHMLQEEPLHCAESIASTVASLWSARRQLRKLGYKWNATKSGGLWVKAVKQCREDEADLVEWRKPTHPGEGG